MGRSAFWAACGLFAVAGYVAPARAQGVPPPVLFAPAHAVLPPVPALRLTWPVAPLAFSFTASEERGYADGPLRLFSLESLWLQTPALQLLTRTSAERAFELDCRSTCQPVVAHNIDLEARVPLPTSLPSVPKTYAFVRSTSFYTSQNPRFAGQVKAGFGGFLNF